MKVYEGMETHALSLEKKIMYRFERKWEHILENSMSQVRS